MRCKLVSKFDPVCLYLWDTRENEEVQAGGRDGKDGKERRYSTEYMALRMHPAAIGERSKVAATSTSQIGVKQGAKHGGT